MAEITVNRTEKPNVPVALELNSLTANTEVDIPCEFKDEHTMFIVTCTAAVNLTIKAGNSYAGVNDEVLALAKGTHAFTINSNRFKNVSGEKSGYMTVVSDGAATISVVEARV